MNKRRICIIAIVALIAHSSYSKSQAESSAVEAEQSLIDWAVQSGARLNVDINANAGKPHKHVRCME